MGDKGYIVAEGVFEEELNKQDVTSLEAILARLTRLENSEGFNIY
jgi:hypothetical protein